MFMLGLIIGLLICLAIYIKFFKKIKLRNFVFIDGTLGSGKSFLTIGLGIKQYKSNLFRVKVVNVLRRIFKKPLHELPLLYSNIKLRNIPYVPLTRDLLQRKNYRFAYKSVVILDDISLIADQMAWRDKEVNERLNEFIKLFRHQTRGGYIITNSQSVADLHYSFKYSMSDYLYIHHRTSIFRLFSILSLEERVYSADNSSVTTKSEDIEESLKIFCLSNKYFKYYDTYCYSIFTDMLPVYKNHKFYQKKDNLKQESIISFKEFVYLMENFKKEGEQK